MIGGLKCGTTSLHHYLNLHRRSRCHGPKELNFFVGELNWPLGTQWYASHFNDRAPVRGESSPTTPADLASKASPSACAGAGEVRLVYMVRDPIDRMLSHDLHNVGGGYEHRALADA